MLKSLLKRTFVYDIYLFFRERQTLRAWEKRGRPIPPPPSFKQSIVKAYAARFDLHVLVETGTQYGEMVNASRKAFRQIYSIELDPRLWERAKQRFARYGHINIIPGDSGLVLPMVLAKVNQPCLFWLDAHAMVNGIRGPLITPIQQELNYILEHPIQGHVILIDDARLFIGEADYPTLEAVRALVLAARPGWVCEVQDDILRIHKPNN